MKSSQNDYGVRAVQRASALLAVLAEADRPKNLTSIAEQAQLSIPTTFRLLRTLEDEGLVVQHAEDGTYSLGFRILTLGNALLKQLDILDIARPHLAALRDAANETSVLCLRTGDSWAHAAQAEAAQQLRRVLAIGERMPLYAGCAGKIFLAAMSEDQFEQYLARTRLVPLSSTTPTETRTLREQVAQVRAQGYAESINERGGGGAGIAVPVRRHDGRVIGAIEISGPMTRYSPEVGSRWLDLLRPAAGEISRAMGYAGGEHGPNGPRYRSDGLAAAARNGAVAPAQW